MARKRNPRLEQAVREAIAELLEEEIADPRVSHVTITDVRVSEDQRHATVYYTSLDTGLLAGGPQRMTRDMPRGPSEVADGLASAAPRLQGLLGRRVRMRNTPTLVFEPDQLAAEARRIDELLRSEHSTGQSGDRVPDLGASSTNDSFPHGSGSAAPEEAGGTR
ncbi:MAG: 30S ribosome-binding factor RbfA [Nitriliruptorales bacterium]